LKESKEAVTKETWKLAVGLEDGAAVVEEQEFFRKNVDCFAFEQHDLGVLKGQEVPINQTDDAPIFRKCGNTDSNFFTLDPKIVPKLGNLRFGNS
jgi:hypothetical protein